MSEIDKAPSKKTDVCLILFTVTDSEKVKNVYTYIDDKHQTVVTVEFDPNKDDSYWDCISRGLLNSAGLDIDSDNLSVNDVFYLGDITSSYFSEIKCFGVNVSNIEGLESKLQSSSGKFHKIGFHHLVGGECTDTLLLSSSFLLAAYF